ncbi:ABC transporter permease [Nocardiopsis composta]|uniref:Sulfonate transport system permease protein n=1 Tax=Nocardiopsis composta TaxID=157465 RepID=A0A7W8VBE1_9ACTN|nr:ABC transporter permease [Nocardiopsis composta]MBB5430047.1 sulfonate transport system permease protein [Nocardiopsis composta]
MSGTTAAPPSAPAQAGPAETERGGRLAGALPLGRLRILIGPVLLLALWQAGSATGLIPERTLAAPSTVLATGADLIATGRLQEHLLVSLGRAMTGLAIGVALGTALALTAGLFRLGEDVIDGPMQILRAVPGLALVPLAIVWFGIGEEVKVFLVVFGTTFPVYVNMHAAIRGVDPRYAELARTVGLNRLQLIRRVVLPGALPGFFVGLRFATAISWLVLVVSEQINATSGIGFLMTQARSFAQTDVIVVGLVVYGLLGLASDLLVRFIERKVLSWRRTFEAQ